MPNEIKAVHEDEYFLEHYGVPKMRWGVWNAETARKYAGRFGRTLKAKRSTKTDKDLKARIGGKVSEKASKTVDAIKEKRQAAKETKAVAKEQGIKRGQRKAFDTLRKETLRSHDPEAVAKGMHTLTDSELTAKITRLEQEKKVRDLANAKKQASLDNAKKAEEVRKAEKDRKASGMGAQLLKSTYNATINYAGKKAVDTVFESAGIKTKGKKTDDKSAESTSDKGESVNKATSAGKEVVAEVLSVETVPKKLSVGRGK